MDYNNKKFKPIRSTPNSEVGDSTIFHYKQVGRILSCEYSGDQIVKGHLLGTVDQKGVIRMRYHQINKEGILMTGKCISHPEILKNGKIRLVEDWEWTSGDHSKGRSVLEEI